MPVPRKTDPGYLHWRFLRAIRDERWATFQKLLEQQPGLVNTVSEHGLALESALWSTQRLKTVQLLLEAGADPNLTDPERPWATPLRAALQRFEEAVPLLLDAGARPTAGDPTASMFHNRYSDLHLAITHCPHHIQALEQAGARYDEKDADGQYPISVLMGTMLGKAHPHALQDYKPRWQAFKDWVARGNAWEDEGHHQPAWFRAWSLLWKAPVYYVTPPDHDRVCWALIDQEADPGRRFRGQTFLHAIAKALRHDMGSHREALEKWDVLSTRYPLESLKQWSRLSSHPSGSLPMMIELVPGKDDHGTDRVSAEDRQEHFFQCLEWMKRFAAIGADANEKTSDGKCLFQVMLDKVSAQWLQDPRVLATLKHIGYDPRLSTKADELKKLFSSKVASKKTVWQTTEELESLVEGWWMELTLPSSSPVVSAPRPRM